MYVAAETPPIPLVDDSQAGLESLGAMTGIAWKPALGSAALLAIPAGFLFFEMLPFSLLLGPFLMAGAAAWAVVLYAKRASMARISTSAGAQIGLVTGIFASWLVLSANAAGMWVARFIQHQGSRIDAEFVAGINKSLERNQQMAAQMSMTSAEAAQFAQLAKVYSVWLLSPEGRAGSVLIVLLFCAAFLVIFAAIGGAAGAKFLVQPRTRGM
jgi:hypothetical protein